MAIMCEVQYVRRTGYNCAALDSRLDFGGGPRAQNENPGRILHVGDFIGEKLGGGFEKLNIIS